MKKLIILVFIIITCNSFLTAQSFTVVIDPGHGGKDGGATRDKIKEKDINLQVALGLGKLIETSHPGVKVVYTRKTDVFVDLLKRAQIANKAKANLFISIHVNSSQAKTTTASGVETYILGLHRSKDNLEVAKRENSVILMEDDYHQKYEGFDPNSPESYIIFEFMANKYMEQSLEFATYVQNHCVKSAKRGDRGVRQAGLLVLRESAMPSVLIELGFINNSTEAKYMSSATGQRTLASAIYSGFKEYKKAFDKRGTFVTNGKPAEKEKATNNPPVAEIITNVADAGNTSDTPEFETTDQAYVTKPKQDPVKQTTNKKPAEKEKTKQETPGSIQKTETENKPPINDSRIEYRVQFLISNTPIAKNSSAFKGLSPVDEYIDDGIHKYTYGKTYDENEIKNIQSEVRKKFHDAFVVKFMNGKRIK